MPEISGLTVIKIGQEEATTTSDTSTATLLYPATGQSSASRICRVRANNHLGSRASGMQGSLDTGTAWPYYRPESRTLRFPQDEFEDAVGGVEHPARERESERSNLGRYGFSGRNGRARGLPRRESLSENRLQLDAPQ